MSGQNLREVSTKHMIRRPEIYKEFLTTKNRSYESVINDLKVKGTWNKQVGDFMPVVLTNVLQLSMEIYSSDTSILAIGPIKNPPNKPKTPILLARTIMEESEHYASKNVWYCAQFIHSINSLHCTSVWGFLSKHISIWWLYTDRYGQWLCSFTHIGNVRCCSWTY